MKTIHFEYLGEDQDHPGAIKWHVEAIHVTTTRNNRKFTLTELREAARSLSFRPLDINHDMERVLPFPENKTHHMKFNETKMVVEGIMSITDQKTNNDIEIGNIEAVSIEQIPTTETCNEVLCEQHGVAFIGLGLLEKGVKPGDPRAKITGHAESNTQTMEVIQSLIVSDEQRICKECDDNYACHSCIHKKKEFDEKIERLTQYMKTLTDSSMTKEEIIGWSMSKVGDGMGHKESWALFNKASTIFDTI